MKYNVIYINESNASGSPASGFGYELELRELVSLKRITNKKQQS
jgi:hypothetical protein